MKFLSALLIYFLAGLCLADPVELTPEPVHKRQASSCSYVPVSVPPAQASCADFGTLSSPAILQPAFTASSLSSCSSQCMAKLTCRSFSYTNSTSSCQFYKLLIANQKLKPATTGSSIYYDRTCFSKTCGADRSCNNQGIQYAIYGNNFGPNSDGTYSQFTPESYYDIPPAYSSTTPKIGGFSFQNPSGGNISVYGSSYVFSSNYSAIDHRGYFYPVWTGTYKISITGADDLVAFWLGTLAYYGWARPNANLVATYANQSQYFTVFLNAAVYYPFRIFYANAQGAASFFVQILDPNGADIVDTNTLASPQIVQYSCDGVSAPKFFAWGAEDGNIAGGTTGTGPLGGGVLGNSNGNSGGNGTNDRVPGTVPSPPAAHKHKKGKGKHKKKHKGGSPPSDGM